MGNNTQKYKFHYGTTSGKWSIKLTKQTSLDSARCKIDTIEGFFEIQRVPFQIDLKKFYKNGPEETKYKHIKAALEKLKTLDHVQKDSYFVKNIDEFIRVKTDTCTKISSCDEIVSRTAREPLKGYKLHTNGSDSRATIQTTKEAESDNERQKQLKETSDIYEQKLALTRAYLENKLDAEKKHQSRVNEKKRERNALVKMEIQLATKIIALMDRIHRGNEEKLARREIELERKQMELRREEVEQDRIHKRELEDINRKGKEQMKLFEQECNQRRIQHRQDMKALEEELRELRRKPQTQSLTDLIKSTNISNIEDLLKLLKELLKRDDLDKKTRGCFEKILAKLQKDQIA